MNGGSGGDGVSMGWVDLGLPPNVYTNEDFYAHLRYWPSYTDF
jgi:hypothetical protein